MVPTVTVVQGCPFEIDWGVLEYTHGVIHVWVGGDMFDPRTSANDPLFFLHHSFVDLLWEIWRRQKQVHISHLSLSFFYCVYSTDFF